MPVAAGLFYFVNGGENLLRPPTILIHGAGGHHLFWPPQVRRLPDERLFAPDLPGHGKSPGLGRHSIVEYSSTLLDFLDTLSLRTVVMVGHSMGSAIALDVATRLPERVAGLVLVGGGARLRVAPELLRAASDPSTAAEAIHLLSERSFAPQTDTKLKQAASQRLADTRLPVLHGDLMACDAFDVRDRLRAISAPTLIVCGEADKMTPPSYSIYLQQQIPGARLQMVPNAGHMVMLEKPDEVAALLGSFLQSIDYRPGR